MPKNTIKYLSFVFIAVLAAANLILAQLSLAQDTQSTQETSQITQQLNPGNFGISHIPGGFSFSPVHITAPGNSYSYYISTRKSKTTTLNFTTAATTEASNRPCR